MLDHITDYFYLAKENPSNEVWEWFEKYITPESLNKKSEEFSKNQLRQIQYLFEQSKALHQATQASPFLVSPLTLYYSQLNLLKLLILIGNRTTLESLTGAHGLRFIYEASHPDPLDNFVVKIQSSGTFAELLRTNQRHANIDDYFDKRITLKELLMHYIDIYDYLQPSQRVRMHPVRSFRFLENPDAGRGIRIGANLRYNIQIALIGPDSADTHQELVQVKPSLGLDVFTDAGIRVSSSPDFGSKIITAGATSPEGLPQLLIATTYDNTNFILSKCSFTGSSGLFDLELYQEEIQILISFILSNLVRYYADVWLKFQDTREESWLIRKSVSQIIRSHHNYTLNRLTHSNLVIMPPGTLHRY